MAPWASPQAQRRLIELESRLAGVRGPDAVLATVDGALAAHRRRYDDGIVLYAGTNAMSPTALAAHDAAVSSQPSMGWPGHHAQGAPADPSDGLRGLRIGTQEVTRRGFDPSHMREIAVLARRTVVDADDRDRIRADAELLRASVKPLDRLSAAT